ncbi:hypothetical protein [Streptomyces sp. SID10815]|uniref:hypothetical protein n=1 Tax=Streptomyces sp. SID10815 TaxID=2706027 RepID=UPI0013CCC66E|nr:hypothetical protein [Streptomyces sp. SID10815]NEA52427.1 hypothetical protein [Streptomyces sp. SID10815]
MADGDVVTMRLTFWRDDLKPGDTVEVPADEVHRWTGYAVQDSEPHPTNQTTTPTAAAGDYPKLAEQPADSAKVDEWRTYAVTLGMDKGDADKATKADLQDYAAKSSASAKA